MGPPDLLRTQAFRVYETLEVVMVCKHENFMLVALQIMSSDLEDFNTSQQLAVVGLIPSLCRNHLSKKKGYQIPLAQIIRDRLTKDSTNSIARSICLNLDMTLWIKMI